MSITDTIAGPLQLPLGRTVHERLTAERLKGHLTSDLWLPQGAWADLDPLRDEHLLLRERLAGELNALAELYAEFAVEDATHRQALKRSMADGEELHDERTPGADRDQAVQDALDKVWLRIEVLADFVDNVVATVAERRDDWANVLGQQLLAAQENRRQAQRLLDQAAAVEHHSTVLGVWLDRTADNGWGRGQPCPPLLAPQAVEDAVNVMDDDADDGIDDDIGIEYGTAS
jgi:hypothetical protein